MSKMNYEYISTTEYNGCERINFRLNGRDSLVVRPKNPLPGNPTAWRTEFFGGYDSVDRALLERGWHLCYHKVSDMYGCDRSLELMNEFHDFASQTFGLAKRVVLLGFSRGGLYAVNYTAKYTDRVRGLYLDAPVLDIRSWPLSKPSSREAKECLECYNLTLETAVNFNQNPLDKIEEIINLPVIIVAGDSDELVPYCENGEIFASRFEALGGKIKTIVKPGCGHHPHSLEDPTPVVDFLMELL
jgi:pimeloyl-ACP methyl ester carboxylesterase